MATAWTPYVVRRVLTFLPLLAVGIIELATSRSRADGPLLSRLHRWGTWKDP